MPIGKALLLKGLGGLAAIGGTIGGGCYIYNRYYSNQETKFDEGLIDYLEAGGKIQFSVKDGTTEISNSFPQFTTSDTTSTATVTIKVSVNTATSGNEGTLTDATTTPAPEKGQKSYLQKLNGTGNGTAWTWVCEIKFTKKTDDATANEPANKDKLVKESNEKGFFNKLKDEDSSNNNKDLKIKFIKDCTAARGIAENRKINKLGSLSSTTPTANEIKSTKEFKLRKGNTASSEEEGKLYPVNQSDFDHWFKNEGN